jgi:long-chain acyl-CoA synthetase
MDWLGAERDHDDFPIGQTTLPRLIQESVERYADLPAQRYKGGLYDRSLVTAGAVPAAPDGEYESLSYEQLGENVRYLATGFRALGLQPGQRVGLFGDTRLEWAQSDLSLLSAGGVVVTVYKSSSPAQVQYLLGDSGSTGVVVENAELLERVMAVIDDLDVRFVISMDDLPPEHQDQDGVYTLGEVYGQGKKRYDPDTFESWVDALDYDDLATLVYTSGTTGQPKGVEHTHRTFRANLNQMYARYGPRPDKGADVPDTGQAQTISFLPLAHILERHAGHFHMYGVGACVGFAESPDTLKEDFELLEPEVVLGVPRVYEKLYDAIREQAEERPSRRASSTGRPTSPARCTTRPLPGWA